MTNAAYRPPGLFGFYPAVLTVEQIHHGNWCQVERSARRWPEFQAIERAHGVDLLPYEARARVHGMAQSLTLSLKDERFVALGWRKEPRFRPYDPQPYLPVLAAYLPLNHLAPLVSAIWRLAETTAQAAPMPTSALFR